jgi:hypothetical protein
VLTESRMVALDRRAAGGSRRVPRRVRGGTAAPGPLVPRADADADVRGNPVAGREKMLVVRRRRKNEIHKTPSGRQAKPEDLHSGRNRHRAQRTGRSHRPVTPPAEPLVDAAVHIDDRPCAIPKPGVLLGRCALRDLAAQHVARRREGPLALVKKPEHLADDLVDGPGVARLELGSDESRHFIGERRQVRQRQVGHPCSGSDAARSGPAFYRPRNTKRIFVRAGPGPSRDPERRRERARPERRGFFWPSARSAHRAGTRQPAWPPDTQRPGRGPGRNPIRRN